MTHLTTDVLIVGAGGAGMYAAVAAARSGAAVLLADKSLIGRGGATIMAQMTVAGAIAEEVPDHWTHHLADTLAAGRGLCNERLSAILCEEGPIRIREMDGWKVVCLGGDTPGSDVAQAVIDFKADLLLLSAAMLVCFTTTMLSSPIVLRRIVG